MNKRVYLSLRIAGWATAAALLCGVGYYGYCVWLLGRYTGGCVRQSRIVAQGVNGRAVELTQDFCAGPAFSSPSALGLIVDGAARPIYFFRYQSRGADPIVTWMRDGRVWVQAQDVQEIYTRRSDVAGVRIKYDINKQP